MSCTSHCEELPAQLLRHVLSFASKPLTGDPWRPAEFHHAADYIPLALVSQDWRHCVAEAGSTAVTFKFASSVPDQLQWLNKHGSCVRSLRIWGSAIAAIEPHVQDIFQAIPHLEYLAFYMDKDMPEQFARLLEAASANCSELKILRLPESWQLLHAGGMDALRTALDRWFEYGHGGLGRVIPPASLWYSEELQYPSDDDRSELEEEDYHCVLHAFWDAVAATCPQLIKLGRKEDYTLSAVPDGKQIWLHVVRSCRGLRKFTWLCVPQSDDHVDAFASDRRPNLRQLNLIARDQLTELSLGRILRVCPNLETLAIDTKRMKMVAVDDRQDVVCNAIAESELHSLRELTLSAVHISAAQLSTLALMASLRVIRLNVDRRCLITWYGKTTYHPELEVSTPPLFDAGDLFGLVNQRRCVEIRLLGDHKLFNDWEKTLDAFLHLLCDTDKLPAERFCFQWHPDSGNRPTPEARSQRDETNAALAAKHEGLHISEIGSFGVKLLYRWCKHTHGC